MKHYLPIKYRTIVSAVTVFAAYGLLVGCGTLRPVKVTSQPAGAKVYASGQELGATPVSFLPDEAFPPRLVGGSYRAVGTLKVEKPGCKPYIMKVNDTVLSKNISVNLECAPGAMRAPAPAAAPAPVKAGAGHSMHANPQGRAVRERLMTLEGLHKDGLVTDAEYKAIRKRILKGL